MKLENILWTHKISPEEFELFKNLPRMSQEIHISMYFLEQYKQAQELFGTSNIYHSYYVGPNEDTFYTIFASFAHLRDKDGFKYISEESNRDSSF